MIPSVAAPAPSTCDLLPVFNVLLGAHLLLTPEAVIEAASDDYLAVTLTTRAQLVGRSIFEAFPDNPATPEAHSTHNLRASLAQVVATGQPHQMAPQHYDVPDPERPGHFLERHWLCTNRPVRDADGRVTHVLLAATDITASRLAEQRLRESQAAEQAARAEVERQRIEMEHLFQQAPVALAVFHGPQYVVALANPHVLRLWGRTQAQALHTPLFELLPEIQDQGFKELLDEVMATGVPHIAHEMPSSIDRDGRRDTVYWNFVYQPLRQEDGHITGVTVVAVEVSEQVRARQQVQQLNQELEARVQARTQEAVALQADLLAAARHQADQRARLYQIFEQTPACIALLRGPGHRFEYVNQAYQELFPGRDLVGHTVAETLPDAVDQGFLALLDGVYRTGDAFFGNELPLAIAQPDGSPPRQAYFTFTYQAYREKGEVVGVSIFAFDVVEQVRARQEREAERQQLHRLFMEAPAPIVILDGPDLVFQLVNPAYQRVFPGRQLAGKPVLEALPEIAGTAIHQCLRGVYDSGKTFVAQELPLQLARHNGGPLEEMFFTFTYQARRNAESEIDGVLVFAHEVTDQVQARRVVEEVGEQSRALAAELAASNQQLTRTNVDLDNFIYTASHDLKAPISNIEGLLHTLRGELPPATGGEVAYILELMQDSVNRFTRTIEHLTDVSRLQKEHDQPHEPVSLPGIIEDVRLDLAMLLQQTRGRLQVDVRAVPTVQFSVKNLRSVVYNLLSNALKYHHPDRTPQVQVRGWEEDACHVLEVQDNGLGLDLTREHELFGMFRRYHTHVDGSGIGLYMVKRMVENTGGRIEVHSTLGEGSTFTVYLPRP